MPMRSKSTGKGQTRVPSRVIAETHKSVSLEMHSAGGKDALNTSPTSSQYFLFTCLVCGLKSETRMVTKTRAIDEGREHRGCIHCGARIIFPQPPVPLSDLLKKQVVPDKRLTSTDKLVTGMRELRLWKCNCLIEEGKGKKPFIYAATVAARSSPTKSQDCPRCAHLYIETIDEVRSKREKSKFEEYLSTLSKNKRNRGYLVPEVLARFPLSHKAHFCCREVGHERYCSLKQMYQKGGCLTCYTAERKGLTLADKLFRHLHDDFVCVPDHPDFEMQDVPAGSRTIAVQWQCKVNPIDHRWKSYVYRRTKEGIGCPYCAGKALADCDSLADRYPDVAVEFDAADNYFEAESDRPTTAAQVRFDLAKAAYFICREGHKYKMSIRERTQAGATCPDCAALTKSMCKLRPDLAAQWHHELNDRDFPGLTPDKLLLGSNKKVWWRCLRDEQHHWLATVKNRARTKVALCPLCKGIAGSLAKTVVADFVHLRDLFVEELNGMPASLAPLTMRRNYYWRCSKCAQVFQRRLEHMLKRTVFCGKC